MKKPDEAHETVASLLSDLRNISLSDLHTNSYYDRRLVNHYKKNKDKFDCKQIVATISCILEIHKVKTAQIMAVYLLFTIIKIVIIFKEFFIPSKKFLLSVRNKLNEYEQTRFSYHARYCDFYQDLNTEVQTIFNI